MCVYTLFVVCYAHSYYDSFSLSVNLDLSPLENVEEYVCRGALRIMPRYWLHPRIVAVIPLTRLRVHDFTINR